MPPCRLPDRRRRGHRRRRSPRRISAPSRRPSPNPTRRCFPRAPPTPPSRNSRTAIRNGKSPRFQISNLKFHIPAPSATPSIPNPSHPAESVNGIALIVTTIPDANADTLRNTWDWLKKKHPQQNIAVLLASEFIDTDKDGNKLPPKVNLLAAVGDPFISKLKAGDWIKAVAPVVGGSGGGRPQLAMAGGKDVQKIDAALDAGRAFAKQKLA